MENKGKSKIQQKSENKDSDQKENTNKITISQNIDSLSSTLETKFCSCGFIDLNKLSEHTNKLGRSCNYADTGKSIDFIITLAKISIMESQGQSFFAEELRHKASKQASEAWSSDTSQYLHSMLILQKACVQATRKKADFAQALMQQLDSNIENCKSKDTKNALLGALYIGKGLIEKFTSPLELGQDSLAENQIYQNKYFSKAKNLASSLKSAKTGRLSDTALSIKAAIYLAQAQIAESKKDFAKSIILYGKAEKLAKQSYYSDSEKLIYTAINITKQIYHETCASKVLLIPFVALIHSRH